MMCFQVFEAVIHWTNHEHVTRGEYISQLLEHVRLPLLPQGISVTHTKISTMIMTLYHVIIMLDWG